MEPRFYIVHPDGTREGSYTQEALDELRAAGKIGPEDQIEPVGQEAATPPPQETAAISPPGYEEPPVNPPKKTSPLVWVLVGLCALCIPCVGVLGAILFPVFSQARIAARQTSTMSNLKLVGTAVMQYSMDFDDMFPPRMESLDNAWPYVHKYYKPLSASSATTSTAMPESLNPGHPGFDGNTNLNGKAVSSVAMLERTLEFFDSAPWQTEHRIVLYTDSHVRKVKEDRFQEALLNGFVDKAN